MDIFIIPILRLLITLIDIYVMLLICSVILSWLIYFKVVNNYNGFISVFEESLYRITNPCLTFLRNFLPRLPGLDISPLVLFLFCYLLKDIIVRVAIRFSGL